MITSKELREITGLRQSQIQRFIHSGCISDVKRYGDKGNGHYLFSDVHVGQAVIVKSFLDSLGLSTTFVREILGQLDEDTLGTVAQEPKNKVLKIVMRKGKPLTVKVMDWGEPKTRMLDVDGFTASRPFTLDLLVNLDPRENYR